MKPKDEEPSYRQRLHTLGEAQEAEVMQALRQYAARAAQAREELGEEVADPGEAALLVDRIEAALASPVLPWELPRSDRADRADRANRAVSPPWPLR